MQERPKFETLNNRSIKVLAHYYVDRAYNPFSPWRERVAIEPFKMPEVGDAIILEPKWMRMNKTRLGPGIYRIEEVRPNKKHPEKIFDYSPYESWFYLIKMRMVIVKPIYTVLSNQFSNHHFHITSNIDSNGLVTEIATITNIKTGEVKEAEI